MFRIDYKNETMPLDHHGHTMIHIAYGLYEINNHVFHEGSITVITWPESHGLVKFTNCVFHTSAVVVVLGWSMLIGINNIFHRGTNICGQVTVMICNSKVTIPLLLHIRTIEISTDNEWSDEDFDMIAHQDREVHYYMHDIINSVPDRECLVARMRADYRFTAFDINPLPRDLEPRYRRLVHSLLAMISARDVKRVGSRSVLRKLPWYLLKMCMDWLITN